jgi:peptide/nickel transport system permease protein
VVPLFIHEILPRLGAIHAFAIVLTYLGLLAVTFFIGRVIPIDPVLAVVGDHAPEHVIARTREEMGLNKPLYTSLQSMWARC